MATITPQKRKGALVSYKFRVCVGRDADNKQIFRCTTWPVPQGLSPAKAAKAAKRAAEAWERETRAAYEYDLHHPQQAQDRETSRLRTDFASFVRHTWFPLCMEDGAHKPKTVAFYEDTMRNITGRIVNVVQGLTDNTVQRAEGAFYPSGAGAVGYRGEDLSIRHIHLDTSLVVPTGPENVPPHVWQPVAIYLGLQA